jgi:flagellar biosynthesis/type III secretory pathway protein FliH
VTATLQLTRATTSAAARLASGRIIPASEFAQLAKSARQRERVGLESLRSFATWRDSAHEHGFRHGVQQALQELAPILASARSYARAPASPVYELLFAVLRKMLGAEDPDELLTRVARAALTEYAHEFEQIALHVHPERAAALRAPRTLQAAGAVRCEVVADASLAPLGCELHTPFGIVDASIDMQLGLLHEACANAPS